VPFAPAGTQCQLFIERLPAHANFWHEHIAVVVQEFFKARPSGKLEGVEPGYFKIRAENRNPGFSVEGVGFSSPARGRHRGITGDVTLDVQHIWSLLQRFPAKLTTKGETNAPSRQLEQRGCVDGAI